MKTGAEKSHPILTLLESLFFCCSTFQTFTVLFSLTTQPLRRTLLSSPRLWINNRMANPSLSDPLYILITQTIFICATVLTIGPLFTDILDSNY